ncbi:MAG TPA: pilus assembly protein N-terminal domain-containing protein [Caulobacteraceae bacterium]
MRVPALVSCLVIFAPLQVAAQALTVNVDQATRVTLPRPARDVIVGNPAIADASVLDATHIVLVGKGFGVTNVVVTDRSGHTMLSRQVVIASPDANRVSIYRGPDVSTYACAPRCERSSAAATAAASPPLTTPAQ